MTYTTLAALTRRVGASMLAQLTDRGELATGTVDASVVDQALADTDAVIDASLARRYRLPLAAVPATVADLALSIALYKLHVVEPDAKIVRDYSQALKDLDALATGAKLLDVAGIEPETSGAGGVIASDRARDLTPDNMFGLI